MEVYTIDIDGTLCDEEPVRQYERHKPTIEKHFAMIAKINKHYDEGDLIKIFTARGSSSGKDWRDLTEKQLKDWGVKYHVLIMGKPSSDWFVDDRNMSIKEFLGE